jgi:glycosyltransferase involved in cell wall biosynthesis
VNKSNRLVFWGTYDTGKPRVRLLLTGARRVGVEVLECHEHVWVGVEDKSQLRGLGRRLQLLKRWLLAYPSLIYRYVRLPRHDAVIVGYPGVLDVLVLWPFTRLRRTPLLWDVFLSLYDTIVLDRRLLSPWSPAAWVIYGAEWLAARAATRAFLDTETHAGYFGRLFGVHPKRLASVPVGVEEELFTPAGADDPAEIFTVLFYGQFIPLHGLDVVIDAATLVARQTQRVRWVIIGQGQEASRIDARVFANNLSTVQRINWVPYEELRDWIRQADVCLGIFGTSEKAHNVIPNKVYQALAMGRRVITSDTPAQRELLVYGAEALITFVQAGDASGLAETVLRLHADDRLPRQVRIVVGAGEVGQRLQEIVNETISTLNTI